MKCLLIAALVLTGFSLAADAQYCAGSHLTYFPRDAKGKLLAADSPGLSFETVKDSGYSTFELTTDESVGWRIGKLPVPASLQTFDRSHRVLMIGGDGCGFHGPKVLKITMNGKTMELNFALPDMGRGSASARFVVDSIPFAAGKFSIDLTHAETVGTYGGFFAATGWKKVQ